MGLIQRGRVGVDQREHDRLKNLVVDALLNRKPMKLG